MSDLLSSKEKITSNYAIYISGVGTKFNAELNIFQRAISWVQDNLGLGAGAGLGGSRRLDYGEDQLNDALKQILIFNAQKVEKDIKKICK
ncbi:hypothetical protein DKE42_014005 [Acinetobacter pittii]|nr:hypothetical protein DKE42_014005 [Acinetobacter pittii]